MSAIGTTHDEPALGGKAIERDARKLLGQVMGLVAVAVAFAALGAYLGRDLSGAAGLVLFVGAFACIFGLSIAAAKGREHRTVRLDQSGAARRRARRLRQLARSSDRRIPGRRPSCGQGPGRRDRARTGRGLPSRFRSLPRRRARPRSTASDPRRDEAGLSDPRRGAALARILGESAER